MARQSATQSSYMVHIYEDPKFDDALRFTFVPKSDRLPRPEREAPKLARHYIVTVWGHGSEATFEWIEPPEDPTILAELESIARKRAATRHECLERLQKLVATVRAWADELG